MRSIGSTLTRLPLLHFRRIVPMITLVATLVVSPPAALAAGPNAVMTPTGYNTNSVTRGDDTSNLIVNLPFTMNWNGTSFTQIYINMNGNATFGGGYTGYNPSTTLAGTNQNIMAPFWADVDTRNTAASQVTYSTTTGTIPKVNGRNAFFVNWVDVARYNSQVAPTNSFQLVLVDRSDTGAGNFDFIFNYDAITWDIGTAASTFKARAGWGRAGSGYELPGSGVTGTSTLLDSSPGATSLIQNMQNDEGQLGRYTFQVRSGQAPNSPPSISVTNRVLEGNAVSSYTGYTGTGDAIASDLDGTVVSLTHDRPDPLPLGTTDVTWTATDDKGYVTTKVQTIVVTDTTPPANPTVASTSHLTGVWSSNNTVSMVSSGSTDICSGVQGFSYGWTQNATASPDSILDPSVITTTTVVSTVTVDSQSFATATWPTEWTVSGTTYLRLTNAAGRNRGSYAAEIWTANTTRRTESFYRDYDLSGLDSAVLSYWDQISAFSNGSDYARVEYSTNGGTSYTALFQRTGSSSATGWTQRSYSLPVGGTVRVRFSGSVNDQSPAEYVDWDDIEVAGSRTTTPVARSTATSTTLADGTWFFNLRTMDNSGNWSNTVSRGPYHIDTAPPVTTSNAPSGWSTTPVTVTLTATDGGAVAYTRYALNGSALTTYTAPFLISTQGVSTLQFWSADLAGFKESTTTASVRIDSGAPTVPGSVAGAAVSTSSIELAWAASTDTVSGVTGYDVYRDGVPVATTSGLIFTDTGLTPGQTYTYRIVARDVAGNSSAQSTPGTVSLPSGQIWLEITQSNVNMGAMDPGVTSNLSTATVVTVGGVGNLSYNLDCVGYNFINSNPLSTTPTMPVSVLGFSTRGWTTTGQTQFGTTSQRVNTSVGTKYVWRHPYAFDFSMNVPFSYEPGVYTAGVTYTAVIN